MMDSLSAFAQEHSTDGSSMGMIWFIIGAVGLYKMFEKAGEPGWIGIIPFYRDYKLCEVAMGNPLYAIRLWIAPFIPVVGIFLYFYWKYTLGQAIAKTYGKDDAWKWGYTFLDAVFFLLTGLDESSYYGKYGNNDSRTGEARSARTVNYEVHKNEPKPKAEDSNEVEFDFHQEVGD